MQVFTSYYLDTPIVIGRVFDVLQPEEITQETAIFLIHGGGWRAGSRTEYHKLMEAFAQRGYVVASTDYRLDAKDAFEQLQDVREAYDAFVTLLKQQDRPQKIAVFGASAGAHLASLLLCAAPGECGEEVHLANPWVKPEAGILQATPVDLYPWEGMMPQTWAMFKSIVGVPYETHREVYERLSLCNYIRPDNPRLFFMEAELEHLFFSEYTKDIQKKHLSWGIPSRWIVYDKMEHGFFYEIRREMQKKALDDFCDFLENR